METLDLKRGFDTLVWRLKHIEFLLERAKNIKQIGFGPEELSFHIRCTEKNLKIITELREKFEKLRENPSSFSKDEVVCFLEQCLNCDLPEDYAYDLIMAVQTTKSLFDST